MDNNQPIRAERKTVSFFEGLEVDGYRMPNGEFRVGIVGASLVLGYGRNWLSQVHSRRGDTLKVFQKNGYTASLKKVLIGREGQSGASVVKTMSLDNFKLLATFEASKGNVRATRVMAAIAGVKMPENNLQTRQKNNPEQLVRDRLHESEGGEIEVVVPVGRIDLLTLAEVVEVKSFKSWKTAIGQVLVYGNYYPSHKKRIHLYGSCHSKMREIIREHCEVLDIRVTFE